MHSKCCAVVWAVLLVPPELEAFQFIVETDHDALKWMLNVTDSKGKLGRW